MTYFSFMVALVLVVLTFITANSYAQLGAGMGLYLLLSFCALKLFPRKVSLKVSTQTASPSTSQPTVVIGQDSEEEVQDSAKRDFLKMIGIAGVSLFVFSIFNRRAEIPFFGKAAAVPETLSLKDSTGRTINPAEKQPLDGYQISEIDDSIVAYYGFTNVDGSWFIMREDTDTSSFRYAKGDKEFPSGWKNRERLTYDYFHNL